MEALYKKLYDKYSKLKTKQFLDFDQLSKDQEVKFVNCVSAADEFIQHLKTENHSLRIQVNDLRDEVASTRSKMDAKCADYQKLLLEEIQKTSTLSEEVEKLRKLQHKGNCSGSKNGTRKEELHTPNVSPIVRGGVLNDSSRRNTRKRSRDTTPVTEELRTLNTSAQDDTRKRSRYTTPVTEELVTLNTSAQDDPMQRQSTQEQSQKASSSELDRCGGNDCVSTNCPYHSLAEHLMGMEVSTTSRNEGICISAIHKSSGYSFNLTWKNEGAGETEILYRVVSLGTFERVAPEWMKESIMFSTSMCPTFFQKVTRVMMHC